jgi:orotate phosphoribosyltransferase
MHQSEVIKIFRECGALLEGHYILRSGRHSRLFFQCAFLLQYPRVAEKLCQALAEKIESQVVTHVISPALGGILVGHELARALNKPHFFTEKQDGRLLLRRFKIDNSMKFLVAEDVVTTGSAVAETIKIVKDRGGEVVAVASLVCRSEGQVPDFKVPFTYLLRLPVETFDTHSLPEDLKKIPPIKPGSL